MEELKELMDKLLSSTLTKTLESLEENLHEPCKIAIEKDKKGVAHTQIEGKRVAILITLAGLEKTILEKTNTPSEVYEFIRKLVGAEDNE